MHLFTREEIKGLIFERDEAKKQLLRAKKGAADGNHLGQNTGDIADICCARQESERHLSVLSELTKTINDLDARIGTGKIVEVPTDTEFLCIGHIATVEETDEAGDVVLNSRRCRIAGYDCSDLFADPPVVSYTAPTFACFLGQSVDPDADPIPLILSRKKRFFRLARIELVDQESGLPAKEETPLRLVS